MDVHGWGPVANAGRECREEDEAEKEEEKEKEENAINIKSNNPHLASGELTHVSNPQPLEGDLGWAPYNSCSVIEASHKKARMQDQGRSLFWGLGHEGNMKAILRTQWRHATWTIPVWQQTCSTRLLTALLSPLLDVRQ